MTKISKLEKGLFLLLIFLFPSQLALHFWPAYSFVFGIRVDFLAPAIYLTDILTIWLLGIWFKRDGKKINWVLKKIRWWVFWILSLALINTLFSTLPAPSLLKWVKIFELSFLALYVVVNKKSLGEKDIIKTLFSSLVFFGAIGILQFLEEKTLGGPLYLLGERNFSAVTPGIALGNFAGRNFLRAYSTFPHPNSLAGYFLGALLLIFAKGRWRFNLTKFAGALVILICLALSFSLTAFLCLSLVLLLYIFFRRRDGLGKPTRALLISSIVFSILLPVFSSKLGEGAAINKNLQERRELSVVAGKLINQNFLFGSGLNTFIINSGSWLLQPVHNIFLLVLSETGIVGLTLFCLAIWKLLMSLAKRKIFGYLMFFLFIILTGLGDHYWFTIQQNLLLLSLGIGLALVLN